MILADIPNLNFIPQSGAMDSIFHQTYLQVAIAGFPAGGYRVTLIGLVIILLIALTANALTEVLTKKKLNGLAEATIVTIIGSYLASAYVLLPFDFALEGVRIVAALFGAVVIAVFLSLLRSSAGGKK